MKNLRTLSKMLQLSSTCLVSLSHVYFLIIRITKMWRCRGKGDIHFI